LLLADACRRVVAGAVPEHAAAIKVRAAGTCYLIRRAAAADRAPSVVILDLFDPSARVELDTGVAEVVATLIEDGVTGKDA